MKLHLTSIFLLITTVIFAQQNLVPNPSFEDTVSCPDNEAQVNRSLGWLQFCYGTPDYYNSCSPSNSYSVPNNLWGNQLAPNNNCSAYVGLYNYTDNFYNPLDSFSYREFIGRELSNPLVIGQKYFVSLKVSLAEFSNCASNNIGVQFSTIYYSQNISNKCLIKNQPKIFAQNIILDTLNWVSVHGSFIADSSYNYVIIGNFFLLNNTDTVMYRVIPNFLCLSYYYLDEICVSTDSTYCSNYSYSCINGIGDYSENNNVIYPNPATNELTIDFAITDKGFFELFDGIGVKRKTVILDSGTQTTTIDLTGIDSGLYFYAITDKRGDRLKTGKLEVIK
jgi:hypothetical protein